MALTVLSAAAIGYGTSWLTFNRMVAKYHAALLPADVLQISSDQTKRALAKDLIASAAKAFSAIAQDAPESPAAFAAWRDRTRALIRAAYGESEIAALARPGQMFWSGPYASQEAKGALLLAQQLPDLIGRAHQLPVESGFDLDDWALSIFSFRTDQQGEGLDPYRIQGVKLRVRNEQLRAATTDLRGRVTIVAPGASEKGYPLYEHPLTLNPEDRIEKFLFRYKSFEKAGAYWIGDLANGQWISGAGIFVLRLEFTRDGAPAVVRGYQIEARPEKDLVLTAL